MSAFASPPVLAYFDIIKNSEIDVGASTVGLGVILGLVHGGHTMAYASRTLTPIEQRYSQTE